MDLLFLTADFSEMNGACIAYGGEERRIKGFGAET
jgi:hypothetical protein